VAQFSFLTSILGDSYGYRFSAPLELQKLAQDSLFSELVLTKAFQRLASIRFLGGIDYLLVQNPNGAQGNVRYTRLQHSMGVARLALRYSSIFELPTAERRLLVAAALLHDIGHAPLSHSVEPVFRESFGIDHHRTTKEMIFGFAPMGFEIYKILRANLIDPDEVDALISGEDARFHEFFSGPINFDTIEGILRTRTFGNAPAAFDPDVVVEAAISRSSAAHCAVVDRFWHYKDQVYKHLIGSTFGILADYACQIFMRNNLNRFGPEDYLSTEEAFFKKLPGLRDLLTSSRFSAEVSRYAPDVMNVTARRFYVNDSADFFRREDSARYVQIKELRELDVSSRDLEVLTQPVGGDLFNNESDRDG
jgi:uncharacterized protein